MHAGSLAYIWAGVVHGDVADHNWSTHGDHGRNPHMIPILNHVGNILIRLHFQTSKKISSLILISSPYCSSISFHCSGIWKDLKKIIWEPGTISYWPSEHITTHLPLLFSLVWPTSCANSKPTARSFTLFLQEYALFHFHCQKDWASSELFLALVAH